jgi:hypothetical protein
MAVAENSLSMSGLFPDPDDQKIFAVLTNYLMLSQTDVGHSTVEDLFSKDPERVVRLLRTMFCEEIPSNWCVLD